MQPHLKKYWCIPPESDAAFVAAMEDVLDVYHRPYDLMRPVVCMDESNKQLTKETRVPIPMKPGQPERVDHEYERNGVADVFVFVEPLAGWRRISVTTTRKSAAFPPHEAKRLADRLEIHYTPKHGSWLNIAEIELSALGKQRLNRRIPDMETMKKEVTAWSSERNRQEKTITWHFSTEDARVKLKYLYPNL